MEVWGRESPGAAAQHCEEDRPRPWLREPETRAVSGCGKVPEERPEGTCGLLANSDPKSLQEDAIARSRTRPIRLISAGPAVILLASFPSSSVGRAADC